MVLSIYSYIAFDFFDENKHASGQHQKVSCSRWFLLKAAKSAANADDRPCAEAGFVQSVQQAAVYGNPNPKP